MTSINQSTYAKRDATYRAQRIQQQKNDHRRLENLEIEIEQLIQIETLRAHGPQNATSVFGPGYSGYGNGCTDSKPRILYPKERKRPRRHLREIVFPRQALVEIARHEEVLVPVRVDVVHDRYKLRDTFLWNLNDGLIPLDLFAEQLCDDYQLPQQGFVLEIQKSLRTQLAEHHPHKYPYGQNDATAGESMILSEAPETTAYKVNDDMRILIKLDITVGTINLLDQFEWDINDAQNNAELFAASLCQELGLSNEFQTAVAHAIREQSQMYTKSLFLVGHSFDGKEVIDADIKQMIIPTITTSIRPKHLLDKYAPTLLELNIDQVDRVEREREREGRRNRRQTRGKRGANLPDLLDLPKTFRTPYMNAVLIPAVDRSITRLGAMRPPMPGTAGNEEDTDEEKFEDEDSPRAVPSARSARASRYATHHAIPPSGIQERSRSTPNRSAPYRLSTLEASTPYNDFSPYNAMSSQLPPTEPNLTSSSAYVPFAYGLDAETPTEHGFKSEIPGLYPGGLSSGRAESPALSLIVRLKIPSMKRH